MAVAWVSAVLTAAVAALLVNIQDRKQEAKNPYLKLVEVDENTVDAARWGMNFPRQWNGYRRTSELTRTKYGGGAPSEGVMPPEKAEKDPWLTRIFAGYAFSIDYRDRRGHAFMLEDQEKTRRTNERKQSGNCLHCHASVMPLYRALGKEARAAGEPRRAGPEGVRARRGHGLLGGQQEAHATWVRTIP